MCGEVEDSSSDNHLEGDDPKKEAVTILTSPLLLGSHIVFSHLVLRQHRLHLGDLHVQQEGSQEGF